MSTVYSFPFFIPVSVSPLNKVQKDYRPLIRTNPSQVTETLQKFPQWSHRGQKSLYNHLKGSPVRLPLRKVAEID